MSSFKYPLLAGVIIWVVHASKVFLLLPLNGLGILPRNVDGLKGVLFAPVIHGDWEHLISNTAPLMVMLFVIAAFYRRVAFKSFVLIYLLTGLAVWVFGRHSFHIGASGVVYGLVSFVFWLGVFRRNPKSAVIALVILFFYSSLFLGIFPNKPGVSWESHLMGGIVGILVAYLFRKQIENDEVERTYDLAETPKKKYFDQDVFEQN